MVFNSYIGLENPSKSLKYFKISLSSELEKLYSEIRDNFTIKIT